MKNEMLLTNRELREANMNKIYVMDKVKKLTTLSGSDYVTTPMVANYYEVEEDTIKKLAQRHRDELAEDGVRMCSSKEFWKRHEVHAKETSGHQGGRVLTFEDGIKVNVPNGGIKIFPRRAILRIGMILKDSRVAIGIRNMLLDTEEAAHLDYSSDDMYSVMHDIITHQSKDISELQNTVIELKSLLTDSLKVISADRAVFSDVMNKQHKMIVDLVEKAQSPKLNLTAEQRELLHEYATTTTPDKTCDVAAWKQNINDLVKVVADETKREKNMVLSDAYKMMKSLYGIQVDVYQREYHAVTRTPRYPSMFDTICWMETKRETSLNGTMERILWSMLDDQQVAA